MSVKFFENESVLLLGDTESDSGKKIWIGRIVKYIVYDQFQKQPLWVADKRVELDCIRIDTGDIDLTIQWYERITGISVSDLVYRFYCDNHPQVQSHTQLVHGKILTTQIYGTADRYTYARYKSPSPAELLHGNDLQ